MGKLLKTYFSRLFKEKALYIFLAVTAAIALFMVFVYSIFNGTNSLEIFNIDASYLFTMGAGLTQNTGIIIALSIAIFLGKEFSQNTIRNKIVIGYSRTKIYLSNFIVSAAYTLMIYAAYQLIVLAVGLPLFGWKSFDAWEFLRLLLNSVLILLSFCALLVFVTMMFRNMTAGIIFGIIGPTVLGLAFTILHGTLSAEPGKSIMDVLSKMIVFGQSNLLTSGENSLEFMYWVLGSSAVFISGLTALGCFLFERLDIK